MTRWTVNIPNGESGNYKVAGATNETGEDSWLNYVNYKNIPEGDYTVLYRKFGESWLNIMQDTAQEYDDHAWLIPKMSGDILIAGLGLGVVNVGLLANDAVTSVTIIEKEQDVIDLVWDDCAKDDRFTLIHADINTWKIPEGSSWNAGWFDTWLTSDESLSEYQTRMFERYGGFVGDINGWKWPSIPVKDESIE